MVVYQHSRMAEANPPPIVHEKTSPYVRKMQKKQGDARFEAAYDKMPKGLRAGIPALRGYCRTVLFSFSAAMSK